jgi:hypothetical protein
VDDFEHIFNRSEQLLSVNFCLSIRKACEVLDIADQMGDTELQGNLKVG